MNLSQCAQTGSFGFILGYLLLYEAPGSQVAICHF